MDYREFAISLAKQAGEIMRVNFSLGMKKEWKADDTPVTATDLAINSLVVKEVAKHYPSHSVLGEEESSEQTKTDYIWICDPVDGTFPFSHGVPTFTFSLALTYRGQSILGVAYDPLMDRLFVADKGKGAVLNDQKIQVSTEKTITNKIIDAEYWSSAKYDLTGLIDLISGASAVPCRLISMVYSGVLVADSEFIGAIFAGKTPWDIAAIKIIVEEAGGKVTDLYGNDQRYDQAIKGAIVSNGLVHDQLVGLVAKVLK